MRAIPLRISTDVNIQVTNVATKLYPLMDTASALENAQTYYDQAGANALMISAEGGDIRYLIGTEPTAGDGTLISKGTTWYLPGIELEEMYIITTAGNFDITVVPYRCDVGESPSMIANDVTLEAGDIEIGAVEIKDGDSDIRVDVNSLHMEDFKDERDNAMCTVAASYGFTTTEAVGQKMRPMVMDVDDGLILSNQQPQLVINLPYIYDHKTGNNIRWEGEDTGAAWTYVTNFPATNYRLVGTGFDDDGNAGAVDSNFWTASITNSGSVVQAGGVVTLNTNTTASGTAKLVSAREARFVAGSALLFAGAFASSAPFTGNTRRIGAYTTTDGAFAQLADSTFSLGTRKTSSDTLINSGNFNGNMGAVFVPVADTYYKLTIEYTPLSVDWYINGKLLHTKVGANWSDTLTLPITMENNNVTIDDATTFKTVGCYIARMGELTTNPTSYYHALGTEAGETLKFGPGTLRGIVVSNCVKNAVITLSDSTTAITPTIWTFTSGKLFELPTTIDFFGLPFSNGLRLYITAQDACVTVIYE